MKRLAVEQQLRLICLEQEVNELCQRYGEALRYAPEFEPGSEAVRDMPQFCEHGSVALQDSTAPLNTVLCTEELTRRSTRPPDFESESRALAMLAQALADAPRTILQTLADSILELLKAGSAGISLLTRDEKSFYWPAVAGTWDAHIGDSTPRDFSPCGDVLDLDMALLFKHPEQRYACLLSVVPLAEECLLVPFYVRGKLVGTIWAVAHDEQRKFDAEDLRQLQNLGSFASAACQAADSSSAALHSGQSIEKHNAKLSESEERYRLLFESLDQGYCVIESVKSKPGELLDFRFTEANKAFAKQSGFEDVVGMRMRQLFPDESEEWFLMYASVSETGQPIRFEHEFITINRVMEIHAFRVADQAHGRVAINFQDITRHNHAEHLLRQNRDTFFDLIEKAPFGIYLVDAQFQLRQVSTAAQKVFYNIHPLIGQDFEEVLRQLWTEPFVSDALMHFRHTLVTGEAYAAPNTTQQRQDIVSVESYDWKIERVTLPDGQFGVVCYFYDVTEQKRAESTLRESEEFSRSIIKSSPDCIKVLDLDGNLLSMESGQNLLGIEDIAPFLNKSWVDFWTGKYRLAAQTAIGLAAAGKTGKFIGFFRTPRGEDRWWDVAISPILNADGKPVSLLSVLRDVTQRQQAEVALRESRRFLQSSMDALSGHIAVLDGSGTILQINDAWQRFADENGATGSRFGVGANYLQHSGPLSRDGGETPAYAIGIKDVIDGRRARFEMEYSCHSPTGKRWFVMRVTLFQTPGPVRIVIVHDDCTQRKLAENAFRKSEVRYRNLFNSMDEGFCIIEMIFDDHEKPIDFRFLEVNPAFERQSKIRGATGKRVRELNPVIEEHWLATYGKVALTGEATRFVSEAKVLSGHWFDVYATPLGAPENRQVAVIFSNITERKKTEQAVRDSEERYRSLFNSMDEGFCIIEMLFDDNEKPIDYRFLEVNPAFERQTGMRDVTGKRVREIIPDLEQHWFDMYGEVALTGKSVRFVNEVKALDRWFDSHAARLGGPKNRQIAIVFDNVTDRKRADEDLRQSEARFRMLFDRGPVAIYLCDVAGMVVEFNPRAAELWGREPNGGDIHERYCGASKLFHTDGTFLPHSESPMVAVLTGEIPAASDVEVVIERPDGSQITVVSNIVPLKNARGEITGAISCFYDITERSRLEQETVDQAQALTELDRRKDEFLAMLSHELRNPLAALSNAVQLLRLQKDEAPLQQQGRNIIERQVGQLKHLVDDLLEISRITTGRIRLRQERITMSSFVERAVETTQPLIAQRHHELKVSLPPQPIWLYADAARLEQVLVNLLTNAAKYSDEGGSIWVSVVQEGDMAVLRVRDTGIGIAPELLPRIFDLFSQAERSIDRSQGGLGIGLCLVQRLVELHGGKVEVRSVFGQGSEFVVRFPVMPDDGVALSPPRIESAQPTGKNCRVLAVDDNVDAVQSLGKLLELTGYEVTLAYDGPSALKAAIDMCPDVVLLDIGLPGLTGYEVAERIRQQPLLDGIVLVALTGYGQVADLQRSKEAGFDHHLVKPAEFSELEKILATVVKREQ